MLNSRAALMLWVVTAACQGEIEAQDVPEGKAAFGENRPTAGPPRPPGATALPGGSTPGLRAEEPVSGTTTPVLMAGACAGQIRNMPAARIWRLSAGQYANSIRQVFGIEAEVSGFPQDGVADDGLTQFDTSSNHNVVSDRLALLYSAQAERLAPLYVDARTGHCVISATPPAGCVIAFLKELGARAFRRPLTNAEADRWTAFHDSAKKSYDAKIATRMVVEAMMQSPQFLYRSELGSLPGPRTALSSHEVAAQLSYALADRPPDAELRAAADRGELLTPASLQSHLRRLLALPEARTKFQTFIGAWTHTKTLTAGKDKDPKLFPAFNEPLKQALLSDALAQAAAAAFDGEGSLDALFTKDLAPSAALKAVYGSEPRQGLISHPAVLSALSNEGATSPVHRGLFYFQTLLCGALPPPPANASSQADKLTDPNNPKGTQLEQWTYFQKTTPACAGCHRLFQPLGLGLENFDPIGRHRTEESGKRIDPSVILSRGDAELDGSYRDGAALAKAIAASTAGRACFALQYTSFAFGRAVDAGQVAESCHLQDIVRGFAKRPMDTRSLLGALVSDETFFFRSYP